MHSANANDGSCGPASGVMTAVIVGRQVRSRKIRNLLFDALMRALFRPQNAAGTHSHRRLHIIDSIDFLKAAMIASRPYAALSRIALCLVLFLPLVSEGADNQAPARNTTASSASAPALIPAPASLRMRKGSFMIDANTSLRADSGAAQSAARLFSSFVAQSHGLTLEPSAGSKAKNGITFIIDASLAGNEAYALDISSSRIEIRGRDASGLQHGAVTLWQLMVDAGGKRMQLPALRIEDAPRFAWRGAMLDSARHFQSVEEIKRLLDAMALHKLNVFHWHLTDDQGWRIEIKRYPRLTEVGGCRIPSGDGGTDPRSGAPRPYCGWYSQEQIREIVRYAADRQITVVPEIDIPGHATAAISAYPELGVSGKPIAVSNAWGVNTHLFNVEEGTLVFLENVLTEVVDLFPGRYVHLGGGEAVKDQWIASPQVQARKVQLGLKTEMQLQSWMMRRLEKTLAAHQRRLLGWDDIMEGDLPASATVMSWRGTEGGLQAASQGHDVVMSPVSSLSLDYLQTASANEPPGRAALVELRSVYAFEPIPAALAKDKRKHVLGLQANVWTEHMRTFARVEHALFPRIAAVAEIGWSTPALRNYDGFLGRLPTQLQRYRALGIGYAKTPFEVHIHADEDRAARAATVTLSNPLGYDDIRYTTDGSAPTAQSAKYAQPLQLRLPMRVRAAAFHGGHALGDASERRLSAGSLLQRNDEALTMCTNALMLRLEDDGPADGDRAMFNVDIFNPCWEWKRADLTGIAGIEIRAGRIPYLFQLAHDEPARKFMPAQSAYGELVIRAGCDGPMLASLPLPQAPGSDGFLTLKAPLPPQTAAQDLCIYFTGDTRPTMWTLDRVRLLRSL